MADVAAEIAIAKEVGEIETLRRQQATVERKGDADIVLAAQSGSALETSGPFFESQVQAAGTGPSQVLSVCRLRRSNSELHDPFRASKKKQQLATIGITDASMLEEQCADWWTGICVGDDR
jgi:hypothetical protein